MKTKEFKGIISQNTVKDNNLILNIIEYSCIPFNSWFETHSRLSGFLLTRLVRRNYCFQEYAIEICPNRRVIVFATLSAFRVNYSNICGTTRQLLGF